MWMNDGAPLTGTVRMVTALERDCAIYEVFVGDTCRWRAIVDLRGPERRTTTYHARQQEAAAYTLAARVQAP